MREKVYRKLLTVGELRERIVNGTRDFTNTKIGPQNLRGLDDNTIDFDLNGLNFTECHFDGLIFQGNDCQGTNFTEASMVSVSMKDIGLKGAVFKGAILRNANLSGADLSSADLFKANLLNSNLQNVNLSEANLAQVNLTGANLVGANLSKANLKSSRLRGIDLSKAGLAKANLHQVTLVEANLSNADLSNADLYKADLSNSNLSGANLLGTNLKASIFKDVNIVMANVSGTVFEGGVIFKNIDFSKILDLKISDSTFVSAQFDKCTFTNLSIQNTNFRQAQFTNTVFQNNGLLQVDLLSANFLSSKWINNKIEKGVQSNCVGIRFSKGEICDSDFGDASLSKSNFSETTMRDVVLSSEIEQAHFQLIKKMKGVSFSNKNLKKTRFIGTMLGGVTFKGSSLIGCQFNNCTLDSVDFTGSVLGHSTSFAGGTTDKTKIDRYNLERLTDYGGLTKGQRMDMEIVDDVAKLRAAFSGFQFWVHVISLAVFLFPYVYHTLLLYRQSIPFSPELPGETIFERLIKFIISGGGNTYSVNWWSFLPFLLALIYNFARFIMLWKTKLLEQEQSLKGVPVKFSLASQHGWRIFYYTVLLGYWVYLISFGVHTFHFAQRIVVH